MTPIFQYYFEKRLEAVMPLAKDNIWLCQGLAFETKYYLLYPDLFYQPFFDKAVDYTDEKLNKLSIAGYCVFLYASVSDNQLDQKDNLEKAMDESALAAFKDTFQALLLELFPVDSYFWHQFDQHKKSFYSAALEDGEYTQALLANQGNLVAAPRISWEDYIRLAIRKSAFGKAALDALFVLSGANRQEVYTTLLESHRYFTIAATIQDDIQDFTEDLLNPQINYAHTCLLNKISSTNGTVPGDPDRLKKLFYLNGTATELLDLAIEQLDKAEALVADLEVPLWKLFVRQRKRELVFYRLSAQTFVTKFKRSFTLSRQKASQNSPEDAIQAGLNFLQKEYQSAGCWSDFDLLTAGMSNVWVTAYLAAPLHEAGFETFDYPDIKQFLLSHKSEGKLWGYNKYWVSDMDSTTCTLNMLSTLSCNITKELRLWAAAQNPDGGFPTYVASSGILEDMGLSGTSGADEAGWTQSHVCVSALAFYFVTKQKLESALQYEQLLRFLLEKQDKDGLWNAYWWTSPLYASSYMVKGLLLTNDPAHRQAIERACAGMCALQQANGAFLNNQGMESALFTALFIDAVCSSPDLLKKNLCAVEHSVQWLLTQQYADGSFESSLCLRVPSSNLQDPAAVSNWDTDLASNENALRTDFMRNFSTGVCVLALHKFQGLQQSGKISASASSMACDAQS